MRRRMIIGQPRHRPKGNKTRELRDLHEIVPDQNLNKPTIENSAKKEYFNLYIMHVYFWHQIVLFLNRGSRLDPVSLSLYILGNT